MAFPPAQSPMGPLPGNIASDAMPSGPMILTPQFDDKRFLELFDKHKREDTEHRWIFEREWLRDIYYILNRQWITFHPTRREWVDKRLQKWVPRPVTPKIAEIVQAIRTTLGAINLAVKVRPTNNDVKSVAAAEIADLIAPLIHEEHMMNQVMREADFWLIATGNACLQVSWNKDPRFNRVFVAHEQCMSCGTILPPQAIAQAGQMCPNCGSRQFQKAIGPDGQPIGEFVSFGRGKTTALSPFEYIIPPNVTRFSELPRIIRSRWRDKAYYESNHPDIVHKLVWEKSPSDRSLQIFKSLATTNDMGLGSQFGYLASHGANTVDGLTEYELWLRPTNDFPEGLVLRVAGDKSPILLNKPDEGIPGPLPYKDIEGNPLFPFVHAQYEHVGGRIYGRSAIAPVIQKQDQLNQLDSLVQLSVQRMANPAWVIPENAGIENITGEPGLIIKWNVLAAQGQGKPERIPGEPIDGSLFEFRAQILKDIEELTGTYDIIKGQKPSGVEAFSALQLLVERSQSRFTSVFQSRGEMYRDWFKLALELERQFGPNERTWAVIGNNAGYTFKHFENAQLGGQVTVTVEDGSNMPKTALGKRAAIEQANQLQLLNPADPDQRRALLGQFGLMDLDPSLDIHVQAALHMQDTFEQWVSNPEGPPPLVVKPWMDPQIHWRERVKWLNTDRMRELLAQVPQIEPLITMHLQELQFLLAPPVGPDGQPVPQGGALAMAGSNRESGATDTLPQGNQQSGPNVGPA